MGGLVGGGPLDLCLTCSFLFLGWNQRLPTASSVHTKMRQLESPAPWKSRSSLIAPPEPNLPQICADLRFITVGDIPGSAPGTRAGAKNPEARANPPRGQ